MTEIKIVRDGVTILEGKTDCFVAGIHMVGDDEDRVAALLDVDVQGKIIVSALDGILHRINSVDPNIITAALVFSNIGAFTKGDIDFAGLARLGGLLHKEGEQ